MDPTPKPAALFGRIGTHLAISLGIALAIAGAISLPKDFAKSARGDSPGVASTVAASASEGKFIDRLSFAAGEERLIERAFTPAVAMMPMVAAWPERAPGLVEAQPAPAPIKLRTAAANPAPLPPRRDPGLADAGVASAPLQLLPVVTVPGPDEKQGEGGWTRIVTAPVTRVAGVVTGTAEIAQAAGSWTWNQATGLLPRW